MPKKYFKTKIVLIVAGTLLIVGAIALTALNSKPAELVDVASEAISVSLTVDMPDGSTSDESEEYAYYLGELGLNKSYSSFRQEYDRTLNTMQSNTGKQGVTYIDKNGVSTDNVTLEDAFRNKFYVDTVLKDAKRMSELRAHSLKAYTSETVESFNASINAYYGLFQDIKNPTKYSATEVIKRAEFTAAFDKVINKFEDKKASTEYKGLLGITEDTEIENFLASVERMDSVAYLNTATKSLTGDALTAPMTKGEAVYMVMQHYFSEELSAYKDTKPIANIKRADLGTKFKVRLTNKKTNTTKSSDSYRIFILGKTLNAASGNKGKTEVDIEMYDALALAKEYNVIATDSNNEYNFNQAITKDEAMSLFLAVMDTANTKIGHLHDTKEGTFDTTTGGTTGATDGATDENGEPVTNFNPNNNGQGGSGAVQAPLGTVDMSKVNPAAHPESKVSNPDADGFVPADAINLTDTCVPVPGEPGRAIYTLPDGTELTLNSTNRIWYYNPTKDTIFSIKTDIVYEDYAPGTGFSIKTAEDGIIDKYL